MVEFDCCECGRHIVAVIPDVPPAPPLCAQCLALPGWHEEFALRAILGSAAGAPWPFPIGGTQDTESPR